MVGGDLTYMVKTMNTLIEIEDMDLVINGLQDAISLLDYCVDDKIINKLNDVVYEWQTYTKPCMKEMQNKIEKLS